MFSRIIKSNAINVKVVISLKMVLANNVMLLVLNVILSNAQSALTDTLKIQIIYMSVLYVDLTVPAVIDNIARNVQAMNI